MSPPRPDPREDPIAPYESLAGLLERELALVASGGLDILVTLAAERAAIVAALPTQPPAGARAALERCRGLSLRVGVELLRAQELILAELGQIDRTGRAADAYRPSRPTPARISASA